MPSALELARRRNDDTCSPYSAIAAFDGIKGKLAGGYVLIDHLPSGRGEGFDGLLPECRVVLSALFLIAENLVSLLDRLEKERIAAFVRMMLHRQRAVSSSNRIVFSVGRYSEGLIMSQLSSTVDGLRPFVNGGSDSGLGTNPSGCD